MAVLLTSSHAFAFDFEVDGIYYNITSEADKTAEVTWETDYYYSGEIVIPETVTYESVTYKVTSIGDYAFDSCESLTKITFPKSITSIGEEVFWGCSGLISIIVEEGNSVYDSRDNCNALIETATNTLILGCNSTIIPNSVAKINADAFWECDGLTSITIPKSVTSIEAGAFWSCSGLTTIIVEEGNSVYDSRDNCNALIETATNTLILGCKSTTIPNSVVIIGESAFNECSNLTTITIPNSVTTIRYNAFGWCEGLTSITIPKSVTSISNAIFSGSSNITTIIVEEGNTVYDSRDNCNAIIETSKNKLNHGCKSTIIPNSVTWIDSYAFYGNKGLTSITIPNSITRIDWAAFYDCSNLTTIYCMPTTPPKGSTPFSNATFEQAVLYVPVGCQSAYEAADYWSKFLNIEEKDIPSVEPSIVDDSERVTPEYYNLQGVKVANPERGLYIKRQGNKTTKVVL